MGVTAWLVSLARLPSVAPPLRLPNRATELASRAVGQAKHATPMGVTAWFVSLARWLSVTSCLARTGSLARHNWLDSTALQSWPIRFDHQLLAAWCSVFALQAYKIN